MFSFYKSVSGKVLAGELNKNLSIGDLIYSINDVIVSTFSLEKIHSEMRTASRPMKIVFHRIESTATTTLNSLLRDSRKTVWISDYLHSLELFKAIPLSCKVALFGILDCIRSLSRHQQCSGTVRLFILESLECEYFTKITYELPTLLHNSLVDLQDELQCDASSVSEQALLGLSSDVLDWLEADLQTSLLEPLLQSETGLKLSGWLFNSVPYLHLSAEDCLCNEALCPYLYTFLSRERR